MSLLLLALAGLLYGQLNRGSVEGTVLDPQGAAVANADVTVTSESTAVVSNTKTNQTGYYQVVGLVPGKYTIRIVASGFAAIESRGMDVTAGQIMRLNVSLKIGSAQQLVEVTSQTPLIQTDASNFEFLNYRRTKNNR
jgi:hypothetical protein